MPTAGADDDDRSTVGALEESLLGGPRDLTVDEVARRADVEPDRVLHYWRTFGLPTPDTGERTFTAADADAGRLLGRLAHDHGLDPDTVGTLVRSLGHTMDRLALWQGEALVEDLAGRYALDDPSARLLVLDRLAELEPVLEELVTYAYRRQLAAVASRWGAELAESRSSGGPGELPLPRAVGFADMVSFTRRTAGLGSTDLSAFVERFEAAARDVVTAAGGRVVKTIGDAVFFVADDPVTGALVALGLADRFGGPVEEELVGAARGVTPVRVSLVWGRVLSRFGDVFGTPVTLAARLTDLAEPSGVWTDPPTAALLAGDERFALEPLAAREVQGLGPVEPFRLTRRR